MNKKVLIVCYSLPPYPGIGGRRWAKFIKEFKKSNIDVYTLSALKPKTLKDSLWTEDLRGINVKSFYFKSAFPDVFIKASNIFDKIIYKIHLFKLLLLTNNDFYDKSCLDKKTVMDSIKEIMENNKINNLIITGAPFHLLYFGALLKKEMPEINFIIDIRDPWTSFNMDKGHSFATLSEKRKVNELEMEKFVVDSCDKIVSVYQEILDDYSERFYVLKEKLIQIPNGFDKDEFDNVTVNLLKKDNEKIRFVLMGSLYGNIDYVFIPFLNCLKEIKENYREMYNKISFEFYGALWIDEYIKYAQENKLDNIHFYPEVPIQKSREIMLDSDVCLLFLMKNYEFTLSTKFFEYVAANKPIFIFSKDGYAPKVIVETQLGYHINFENTSMLDDLVKALNLIIERRNVPFKHTFDIDLYSTKNLSSRYIELLN